MTKWQSPETAPKGKLELRTHAPSIGPQAGVEKTYKTWVAPRILVSRKGWVTESQWLNHEYHNELPSKSRWAKLVDDQIDGWQELPSPVETSND